MTRYQRTILGTCCIPWTADGAVDEPIFRDSIRLLLAGGLTNLYIFGTAGEGYAVDEGLFDHAVRIFVEEMHAGGGAAMVGVISLSLRTIQARIERAARLGVREFQLSLPAWGALSDRELGIFFDETCGRFPECTFLHYNLLRARRLVTPAEYAALAARHPNLVATKNSTGDLDRIAGLLTEAGTLRHFLTEYGFAHGCLLGEPGLLVSLASVSLTRMHAFYAAGVARDLDRLLPMQQELRGLGQALLAAVGDAAHMDGAFDKLFCRLRDPRFPLRLLPPYAGADEAAGERFRAALQTRYPAWAAPAPAQEMA